MLQARSLGDKGERTVGVNGDHHGDDQAHIVLSALVELLGEGGNVDAVLTKGRTDGGRGSRLAGGNLKFHITSNFLCHLKQHLLR